MKISQNNKLLIFHFILLAIFLTNCGGIQLQNVRPLTEEEQTILQFCQEWHGIKKEIALPVIGTEIELCNNTKWSCYISYGIIILAPDVDKEFDIFGRVERQDGTSEVKGFIIAHEFTHYLRDMVYGNKNLDAKHESSWFGKDSCIIASRDNLQI